MSPSILRIRCPTEYFYLTPVARDLNDATRNLIQQGRQQTTVVDPGSV